MYIQCIYVYVRTKQSYCTCAGLFQELLSREIKGFCDVARTFEIALCLMLYHHFFPLFFYNITFSVSPSPLFGLGFVFAVILTASGMYMYVYDGGSEGGREEGERESILRSFVVFLIPHERSTCYIRKCTCMFMYMYMYKGRVCSTAQNRPRDGKSALNQNYQRLCIKLNVKKNSID